MDLMKMKNDMRGNPNTSKAELSSLNKEISHQSTSKRPLKQKHEKKNDMERKTYLNSKAKTECYPQTKTIRDNLKNSTNHCTRTKKLDARN